MSTPYAPTPFDSPVLNPAVGGVGYALPYLSTSMYRYAPTAMDVDTLVPNGTPSDQDRALADTIRRASGWADRVCFGVDAAAKGVSLAATQNVQSAKVPVLGREMRLICDYKPILSVVGIDLGSSMASLQALSTSDGIRIGSRTIYVPIASGLVGRDNGASVISAAGSFYTVVWSYVNGYPHTSLSADASAGDTTVSVSATDDDGGLLGVFAGTRLSILDGANTETFTVKSVSGTTITTVSALSYDHAVPESPDFLPVTAIPADVEQAVIFLVTALIKTRGDNSLVLDNITEPTQVQQRAGDEWSDVKSAMELLKPYRVRVKS